MILVSPEALDGLKSEDRVILMRKFKRVFVQAADEQGRLALEQRFVPYPGVSE